MLHCIPISNSYFLGRFFIFLLDNSHSTPIKMGIEILNFKRYIFFVTSKICLIYKIEHVVRGKRMVILARFHA